jgi:antitoxin (DNA-binding transcriptional repressor) of toxin-antitoxin stability system
VNGDPFTITKAGKPIVQAVRGDVPEPKKRRRLGFMRGRIKVPEDFDRMGEQQIEPNVRAENVRICWIPTCGLWDPRKMRLWPE